jgi:hypothetical protein
MSPALEFAIVSVDKTAAETGTSASRSVRFCAVITTSSSAPVDSVDSACAQTDTAMPPRRQQDGYSDLCVHCCFPLEVPTGSHHASVCLMPR